MPGGLVTYPSSVVMNIVPARWPGSPRSRWPRLRSPSIATARQAVLAACALLGIEEVHAAGGAQAIAMFAYGTADCAPADVVTGPGKWYRRRGQTDAPRRRRHRRRRPARPRWRSSPTTPRRRASSPT